MSAPVSVNTLNFNGIPNESVGGSLRRKKTITYTTAAGSDRLLVMQVMSTNTGNTVTHDATISTGGSTPVNMSRLLHINRGGLSSRMSFFAVENPPVGTHTIVINFNVGMFQNIAVHVRSFTGSGGVGNVKAKGGKSFDYNALGSTQAFRFNNGGNSASVPDNIVVEQDSRIMVQCLSSAFAFHATHGIQIPKGTLSIPYVTASTVKPVAFGAISGTSGHNAGEVEIISVVNQGSVTLDRVEIKGLSGGGGGGATRRIIIT